MAKPELTHIQYEEPHPNGGVCTVTLTRDQVLAFQQLVADREKHVYPSDDAAVQDFMVAHWASYVMDPRERNAWETRLEQTINALSADFAGLSISHGWVAGILRKARYILHPELEAKESADAYKPD